MLLLLEKIMSDETITDNTNSSCTKPLIGDIFIVPNSLNICEDHGEYSYSVDNCVGLQVCLQGWLTNDACDNWCSHYYEKFHDKRVNERFPVELFMGKREGDTVELSIGSIKMILTCRQLPYRYGNIKFEDRLYDLTQSFGGICCEKYFNPPLHKRSQQSMIIANHERYARSLGLPSIEPTKFRYVEGFTKQCLEDSNALFLIFI